MNPIKWVRWKVVIVFAVLGGGLYFLGLNPLAHQQINSLGSDGSAGARFSVEKVGLGLLQGRSSFDLFQLATPGKTVKVEDEEKARVAKADEIVCDLGMDDFLRKRFAVDEVGITRPLLRLERRADGTINVGDIGQTEPQEPEGKPTDWVEAIKEWGGKLKKRIEERQRKAAEEREKGSKPPEQKGMRADYSLAATYPFEDQPRALVRKLRAEALEIQFKDATGELQPPPIKNGKIEILNLSDRPEVVKEPIQLSISGEIEGAPIEITGTIDLRKIGEGAAAVASNILFFNVKAKGMPLQNVVQAFAGDSLNATFEKGTADLDAEIRLTDLTALSIRPPAADKALFALHGVQMQAKPGAKIAGFDGEKFAQAVNEVGDLEIKDLEIGGTLTSPEFKWGDTVKTLVLEGGKAFAKKQAQKGIDKGTEKAQGLLDKNLSPDAKKAVEGVLPGADVKKAAGGLLPGLFGGKKEEPKAPEPPPEGK
jgi:hypothetical protein